MARTATFKAREFSVPPAGMGVSYTHDVEETPLDGAEETEGTTEETTEEVAAEDANVEATEAADETVVDETTEETEAPAEDAAFPEGDPSSTWKVGQINAWAAAQTPVVEFPEGATRLQKLALIKDLLQEGNDSSD